MGNKGQGLKEVAADFDFKALATSARLDLGNKRVVKLKHRHPANAATIEASTPDWLVSYDLKSKDVVLEHKRKVRWGDLTVRQRVPNSKFYLVPTPMFKLAFNPAFFLDSTVKSATTISHDYLASVGTIQQDFTYKSKYTASYLWDTAKGHSGASFLLTAKLNTKKINSVGLNVSRATGPVLKGDGLLGSGADAVKLKAEYRLRSREARLELVPRAFNRLALTLTSTIKTDKAVKPYVMLSGRVEL